MDPDKCSPLDAWASKHLSVMSTASMDILGELPLPPLPPKEGPEFTPERESIGDSKGSVHDNPQGISVQNPVKDSVTHAEVAEEPNQDSHREPMRAPSGPGEPAFGADQWRTRAHAPLRSKDIAGDKSIACPSPYRAKKELPPLPQTGDDRDDFDFKKPNIHPVQSRKPVISQAVVVGSSRQPPQRFDFNSIDDHIRMAIYQLEEGSPDWALFHIEYARTHSPLAQLLWDVGRHENWWRGHGSYDFGYTSSINLEELRNLAGGHPAPRLAVALSSMAPYGDFFDDAAEAMDVPSLAPIGSTTSSIASTTSLASSVVVDASAGRPGTPKQTKQPAHATATTYPHNHPYASQSASPGIHTLSGLIARSDTPDPLPTQLPAVKPFARTHGRSDSNQSLNSAHMFPYPWRHSRSGSQTSFKSFQ